MARDRLFDREFVEFPFIRSVSFVALLSCKWLILATSSGQTKKHIGRAKKEKDSRPV